MIKIKVLDWMPWQAIDIAKELQAKGYVMGIDFDWEYHKPQIIVNEYEGVYNRFTIFRFYKEELATWFSLTYT